MGDMKEMHESLPDDDGSLPQAVRRQQALGGRVEDHPEGIRLKIEGRLIYRQVGTKPDAAQVILQGPFCHFDWDVAPLASSRDCRFVRNAISLSKTQPDNVLWT
jgi:hypothetical protein